MGVPGLLRWLHQHFPTACRISSRLDLGQPPHSLFIDLNSTLHQGGRQSNGDFNTIVAAIEQIVHKIQPQKLLFLAIDGVPPRMKERLQRERRSRLATSRTTSKAAFNAYTITPGTPWMRMFEIHLVRFIEEKLRFDPEWRGLNVVFSGCQDPGEGEQKIMEYLRAKGNGEQHCVWSNDADTVLLSLATHVPGITMVSERQSGDNCSYTLVEIDDLAERISKRYSPSDDEDTDKSDEGIDHSNKGIDYSVRRRDRLIDDLVFMTFFAGNDFLPPGPFIKVASDALCIHDLWMLYARLPAKYRRNLHDRGVINIRAFKELLALLSADGEDRAFRNHVGATALGSQITASRLRRMEWDTQRTGLERTPPPVKQQRRNAKRKKDNGRLIPHVWTGDIGNLSELDLANDLAWTLGTQPLRPDADVEYNVPENGGVLDTPMLTLDRIPLICPSLVSSALAIAALVNANIVGSIAAQAAMIEVDRGLGNSRIKWLQSFARYLHLECEVRGSSDPLYQAEFNRWKKQRTHSRADTVEKNSAPAIAIVLGDFKLCPPTHIITVTAKFPTVQTYNEPIALVSDSAWDTLLVDGRTEHRRSQELFAWKSMFYRQHYPKMNPANFIHCLCKHYAEALGWTALYYFSGQVSSWEFSWPNEIESSFSGVAPLESDLLVFLDVNSHSDRWDCVPVSEANPPLLREHLLCVMPKDSWQLMSEKEREMAQMLSQNQYSDVARMQVHNLLVGRDRGDAPLVYFWYL
ncbi:exonuclease II Exo2 [Kickxella alabastrina]|uniref:Exonuclease II Exo2 n=1 Tax=Kickxella alabastrina TaxID=61397 RepID=A0ACC1ICD2_9FUNG|nr:exonuclease II Exo2 [Kickxella alabastrina]